MLLSSKLEPRYSVDSSVKVYTQLAREGVVATQEGGTERSLVLSSRRVTAHGDHAGKHTETIKVTVGRWDVNTC